MKNHHFIFSRLALACAVGTAALVSAPAAVAQMALEEIVVTARKRQESAQDIPVAVSALSAAGIEKANIRDIMDIAHKIPGLKLQPTFGNNYAPVMALRGQLQRDTLMTADPSVGLYLDEVYIPRVKGAIMDMYDIDGVEVLKGVQGTLYGRNSTGGAMKINTRTASVGDGTNGYVGAKVGNRSARTLEGGFGAALGETVAVRIAGRMDEADGYTKITLANVNEAGAAKVPGLNYGVNGQSYDGGNRDSGSVRGSLVWNATDALDITLRADWSDSDNNGQLLLPLDASGNPQFKGFQNSLSFAKSETTGHSVTVDYTFSDDVSAKLIYGNREVDDNYQQDSSGFEAVASNDTNSILEAESDSVEFQLIGSTEKIDWLVGLYWFDESGTEQGKTVAHNLISDIENTSKSIFSSISYDLTDRITLNAGIRYTEDEKAATAASRFHQPSVDLVNANVRGFSNPLWAANANAVGFSFIPGLGVPGVEAIMAASQALSPWAGVTTLTLDTCFYNGNLTVSDPACDLEAKDDYSNTSFTLGADYQLNDDALVYIKFSTGYRSGAFNFRGLNTQQLQPIQAEEVEEWEIGLKADWLDGKLRTNIATFVIDRKNPQNTSIVTLGSPVLEVATGTGPGYFHPTAPVTTVITNQEDVSYEGIEFEVSYVISDMFSVNLGGSLVDDDFERAASGLRLWHQDSVPRKQFNVGLNMEDVTNFGAYSANLDYNWRDDAWLSPSTISGGTDKLEGVGLLSANATVTIDSLGVDVSIFGRNLTDEEYQGIGLRTGQLLYTPGEPRSYGLGVRKDF